MAGVTIVVPAKNENSLESWTRELSAQFTTSEIVIVTTSPAESHLPGQTERVKSFFLPHLKTRAEAMNEGAKRASQKILLFLHADCRLAPTAIDEIEEAIGHGALGGAFLKTYEPSSPLLNWQSRFLNRRITSRGKYLVGTNGLFILKELFDQWGGYDNIPLMEDVRLFGRLAQTQRMTICPSSVIASGRRYSYFWGLPRMVRNLFIYGLYRAHVSPQILARLYG